MSKILRVLIPLAIIALGVVVLRVMVMTKPEPKKVERVNPGTLVETVAATTKTDRVRVDAKGTVVPSREVRLSPEVSGRVSWMAKELVPGGRLQAGELMVRLDARDYQLAVDQQYASVDRARTELKLEQSRKKVAEKEWTLFGPNASGSATASPGGGEQPDEVVALREPQMRTAKVAVKAAESGLERAKLTVSKTSIRAPFNAMVRERQVEIGQLVGPQSPLATLVGTDTFWVQVLVPVDDLSWIRVPGLGGVGQGQGSVASISQTIAETTLQREGRVIRLLGDVDPVGRMARLLVEIDDPLGLRGTGTDGAVPLLLGSYVQVELEGPEVSDVVAIPRVALREGDKVYLRSKEDTLEIREVHVLWRRENEVLIDKGLSAGDRVIVTPVSAAAPGLKLRGLEQAEETASTRSTKAKDGSATP